MAIPFFFTVRTTYVSLPTVYYNMIQHDFVVGRGKEYRWTKQFKVR